MLLAEGQNVPPLIVHALHAGRWCDEIERRFVALGHIVVRHETQPDWDRYASVLRNPEAALIVWGLWAPPKERKCQVLLLFCEAFDLNMGKLIPSHKDDLDKLRVLAKSYDKILCHTPWMCEVIGAFTGVKTHLFPLGYFQYPLQEAALRFGAEVHAHGGPTRESEIMGLRARLGRSFIDLTGFFDAHLIKAMQHCVYSLYVPHSPVRSFSTWRMWQAVAAGLPIVVEGDVDVWPELPGFRLHAPLTRVRDLLTEHYFDPPAALERPAEWTTSTCVERFLYPAINNA